MKFTLGLLIGLLVGSFVSGYAAARKERIGNYAIPAVAYGKTSTTGTTLYYLKTDADGVLQVR